MTTEEEVVAEQPEKESPEPSAGTQNTEPMIPKSRLDQVLAQNKELAARIAAQEKASKAAEEKRLTEQEEWKTLAEKYRDELEAVKPKASVAEALEEKLQEYVRAEIEQIPEEFRSLVHPDLTTAQKLEWLKENKAKLLKPIAPDIGAGQRGSGGGQATKLSPEEVQIARDYGMTPEEYAKYKDKE